MQAGGEEPSPARTLSWALAELLNELDAALGAVTDEQYVQNPVGVVASSVGGHVRHCLDHVEALLGGIASGRVDYDQRTRGTIVERDRSAARAAIRRQCADVAMLGDELADCGVRLSATFAADAPPTHVTSTLGREALFVLSHTVHHNALIAAMCRTLNIRLPERFGYAPATVAYLESESCAR